MVRRMHFSKHSSDCFSYTISLLSLLLIISPPGRANVGCGLASLHFWLFRGIPSQPHDRASLGGRRFPSRPSNLRRWSASSDNIDSIEIDPVHSGARGSPSSAGHTEFAPLAVVRSDEPPIHDNSLSTRTPGTVLRPMLSSIYRRAIAVAACVAAIGCRPAEQIHTYNVPKETVPHVTAASPSAEPTDRMLAAILPDGDKAWFFKVVAPLTEINERADKVTKFFASVRLAAGKPHPDWQLPEGWEEQPGAGMRIATITIPTSGKPLELSVTSLPWTGDPGRSVEQRQPLAWPDAARADRSAGFGRLHARAGRRRHDVDHRRPARPDAEHRHDAALRGRRARFTGRERRFTWRQSSRRLHPSPTCRPGILPLHDRAPPTKRR